MEIEISWCCRASELEFLDRLDGDLTIEEVVQVFLILSLEETRVIPEGRLAIECIDILSFFLTLTHEVRLHLDPCLLRKDRNCFSEVDLLDLHEKSYRSPSLPTGETVSNILLGRDNKGWGLLTMKWAESLVVDSCLLRLDISIHDIEDVDTRFDLLGE